MGWFERFADLVAGGYAGTNPNAVKKPTKKVTKTICRIPYGYFKVTIFTYDGTWLPKLGKNDLVELRYHPYPKRIRSIYTDTVSDCPNYLTYDGHVIGTIFDENAAYQLNAISEKKSVHIYAESLGYDQGGFPRLITKLPSRADMAALAK